MTDLSYAPWTEDEVQSLNDYQDARMMHPFTCGNNSNDVLEATADGWICLFCEYIQDWAHLWMADGSWRALKWQ